MTSVREELRGRRPAADAGTVLVVDDSAENRYAVRRALTRAGLTVWEADSGVHALARAAEDPDVIVLDVNLPDISGFEVCRRLKASPASGHVPVLHLSQTRVDTAARVHGLDGGADAYLTEPVDPGVLVATTRALLRMRRAEDQLRRDLTRAEALRNLAGLLADAHTTEEMAAAITGHAHRVLDAQHIELGLLDRETATVTVLGTVPAGPDERPQRRQVPLTARTVITEAISSGRRLIFDDRAALEAAFPLAADQSGYQTLAVVPILLPDGQVAGALAAGWPVAVAAEHALAVLADVALRCTTVLVRGQLARRRARDLERAELTARVLGELEAAGSAAARTRRLVELLVPALADYAVIEGPGARVRALSHRNPDLVDTLRMLRERHALPPEVATSSARAAGGEPQLIARITAERLAEYAPDPDTAALLARLGPRSHMSVPLTGEDTVLVVGISDPGRPHYTPADLDYVQELAVRAGLSITAAQLLEHEHATAERLQRALLPAHPLTHPRLELAARYLPGDGSLQIGGDWHESLCLPDGRIVLGVGDIVGHGLEAAATMGQIRTGFAALAPHSTGPADLLSQLSEFAATIPAARCSSVICAVIDPATGALSYACAGHPPPVLVTATGPARLLDAGRSPLLGLPSPEPREQATAALTPGATLLLYSDGLVERRHEPLTTGLERLRALAGATTGHDLDTQCDEITTALSGHGARTDDVVLLAARLTFPPTPWTLRFPAEPAQLAPTRHRLRAWLTDHDLTPLEAYPVLLAVGEALANAVEHAYTGRDPGPVELTAALDDTPPLLTVTVSDTGRWRPRHPDPSRGRGTTLMRTLATTYHRSTDHTGTTVTMSFTPHPPTAPTPTAPTP